MAVIGYGYWGPNLVRNFGGLDGCEVTVVCDPDPAALARASQLYPAVGVTASVDDLLSGEDVDAVAIATPVSLPTLTSPCIASGGTDTTSKGSSRVVISPQLSSQLPDKMMNASDESCAWRPSPARGCP